MRASLIGLALLGAAAGAARAATAAFDVQPASGGTTITVQPGQTVDYEIVCIVSEGDNDGLALFSLDLLNDLGLVQDPITDFSPLVNEHFDLFQQRGTPRDDGSVTDIAATQSLAPSLHGFAVGTVEVLAFGTLRTPEAEGTYTVTVGRRTGKDITASVIPLGCEGLCNFEPAETSAGPGFTIVVRAGDDQGSGDAGDGDTSDDSDSAGDQQNDNTGQDGSDDDTVVGDGDTGGDGAGDQPADGGGDTGSADGDESGGQDQTGDSGQTTPDEQGQPAPEETSPPAPTPLPLPVILIGAVVILVIVLILFGRIGMLGGLLGWLRGLIGL